MSSRPVPAKRVPRASFQRPSAGFTLIELMVTVAVLGILAVVAVPAMQSLVNGNRLAGATGELTSALHLARSEAVRRSARVTICRSADGEECEDGTEWDRWIIVGRDNTSGEDVVIRDESVAGPIQVTGPENGIQFRPSGLIAGQETLTVCMPTANPAENQRTITVLISGATLAEGVNGGGECP